MSFEEKIIIVFISVLFSSLINFLLNIYFRKRDNLKIISAANENLRFLARNMERTIIHENIEEIEITIKLLLEQYCVFSVINEMKKNFHSLHDIYVFIKNTGYQHNHKRKEQDLETVLNIRDKIC